MSYNKTVLDHFFHPRHVGEVESAVAPILTASIGSHAQGDMLELTLCCDKNNTIQQIGFKAYGNPYLIAAMSWLCEQSIGQPLADVCQKIGEADLFSSLEIPKSRMYSIFLIEDLFKQLAGESVV